MQQIAETIIEYSIGLALLAVLLGSASFIWLRVIALVCK